MSLSIYTPDGVVTMNQVTNSLLNKETRRKSMGSSHSKALVTKRNKKSKNRKPQYRDKSKGRSKSIKKIICYHCDKLEHIIKKCWNLRKKDNDEKK